MPEAGIICEKNWISGMSKEVAMFINFEEYLENAS